MTEGYSASDLKALASDASLGPIRGRETCESYCVSRISHATT